MNSVEIKFSDVVTINIPLFIRLLELAREDIKTDVGLHLIAEKLTEITKRSNTATMADYDSILEYINVASK